VLRVALLLDLWQSCAAPIDLNLPFTQPVGRTSRSSVLVMKCRARLSTRLPTADVFGPPQHPYRLQETALAAAPRLPDCECPKLHFAQINFLRGGSRTNQGTAL